MNVRQPAETMSRSRSSAGVFVKTLAQVITIPISPAAENNVRGRRDDRIQLLMFARQLLIQLQQRSSFHRQFFGPVNYAFFQITIERGQLLGLAMQFGEDTYFRAQQ